jgi:hypothetical protein
MVRTRIIKIELVSPELKITKTKVKIVKGVQARDILSAFNYHWQDNVICKKTRKVLNYNTDVWDFIKNDKTPEFYLCVNTPCDG